MKILLNYNKSIILYSPNLQFMKYDCFNKCWNSPIILLSDLFTQGFHMVMTESEITKTKLYLSKKLHNQLGYTSII